MLLDFAASPGGPAPPEGPEHEATTARPVRPASRAKPGPPAPRVRSGPRVPQACRASRASSEPRARRETPEIRDPSVPQDLTAPRAQTVPPDLTAPRRRRGHGSHRLAGHPGDHRSPGPAGRHRRYRTRRSPGPDGPAGADGPPGPAGTNGLSDYAYVFNTAAEVVPLEADISFSVTGDHSGFTHAPGSHRDHRGDGRHVQGRVLGIGRRAQPGRTVRERSATSPGTIYGSGAGTQQNSGQTILILGAGTFLA